MKLMARLSVLFYYIAITAFEIIIVPFIKGSLGLATLYVGLKGVIKGTVFKHF